MIDIDKLEIGMKVGGGPSRLEYVVTSIDRFERKFGCISPRARYESFFSEHCALQILSLEPTPGPQLGKVEETPPKHGRGRPTKTQVEAQAIDIHASYAAFRATIDAVFQQHAPKAKYCSDIVKGNEFLLEFNVGTGVITRRYPATSTPVIIQCELCDDLQSEALRLGNKALKG